MIDLWVISGPRVKYSDFLAGIAGHNFYEIVRPGQTTARRRAVCLLSEPSELDGDPRYLGQVWVDVSDDGYVTGFTCYQLRLQAAVLTELRALARDAFGLVLSDEPDGDGEPSHDSTAREDFA
jgi:hypothetical protein